MSKSKPKEQPEESGKRPVKIYLDRAVFRRLREEHAERDMPVSHIVEECLARRYKTEPPAVAG